MEASTKKNLITAKHNLKLARTGHDLLELKFIALQRTLKHTEKSAKKIRDELQILVQKAERAFAIAKMECGEKIAAPFKFQETCAAFDEAYFLCKEIFIQKQRLAEIEETLAQLKIRTSRTRKRASALKNIAIPSYKSRIKYISERLEEHERDERIRINAI
ncbi:MAG: hypothetical protein FWF81_13195 [Defluviitaleaceae bacterium]|nr:hypothetical protein [Defluviitaleaceae bacterium]